MTRVRDQMVQKEVNLSAGFNRSKTYQLSAIAGSVGPGRTFGTDLREGIG